jgi:hypothetical protein
MASTVPRFHAVHLPFRGRSGMRRLPLQTDGELNHQQRRNHPVCGSVTHDSERTPVAVMREATMATGFGHSQGGMTCELCK